MLRMDHASADGHYEPEAALRDTIANSISLARSR